MFRLCFSSLEPAIKKAIYLACLAIGVVAASYGSLATAYGLPIWVPLLSTLFVLAGASEFLFVTIIASAGHPLAAALTGLLVNARHLPCGIAVCDLVGSRLQGLLGCHLMNDESVVVGLAQPGREQRRAACWLCGLEVAIVWPTGTMPGSIIGKLLPNIQAFGLDAVFPAMLLAPGIRHLPDNAGPCLQRCILIADRYAVRYRWATGIARNGRPAGKEKIVTSNMMIIAGIAVLAIDTYLMRFAGVKLGNRVAMSEPLRTLLSDAATTLLFAVAPGHNTVYEGVHFAGFARVVGVTVAVVLAWHKMPLIIVIFAATLVTALLRYAGIQ